MGLLRKNKIQAFCYLRNYYYLHWQIPPIFYNLFGGHSFLNIRCLLLMLLNFLLIMKFFDGVFLYLHFTAPLYIAALIRKGTSIISQHLVFNPIAQNAATYLGTLQVSVYQLNTVRHARLACQGLLIIVLIYN